MRSFLHYHAGCQFSVSVTGDGPAMIFQHGLCGNASQTSEVFPVESGWRCLTMECRGHGRSEVGAPENFSIATFAEDVASLIKAQGLAPVVLGGISMGAAIAIRLAVRRSELVRALILARPAWIDETAPSNLHPNAVVGDLLGLYPPDEARARFEASDLARQLQIEAPDNLSSLLSLFSREPHLVTRELLRRISADGPGVSKAEIAAICVPTLVIGHTRDFVHPLALAQALSDMIPCARMLEITPKAKSLKDYSRDFSSGISAFLKEMSE
jgi:pimeloyl-ACP methyl ester carboxylesterase